MPDAADRGDRDAAANLVAHRARQQLRERLVRVVAPIARAIMQGRLEAGTRLPEHRLAAIFGVSRERIRKVLHRLAAERRLELSLNRGARVPSPTIDDVKRIYEAHRVLEVGVLTQLIEIVDRGLFARMPI
jgi:DNA-binding GntR family transcriptional regulator